MRTPESAGSPEPTGATEPATVREPAAASATPEAPEPDPAPPAARSAAAAPPAVPGPTTGSHAPRTPAARGDDGEPVVEDVEVTDLLMILDLTDEVVVVDEHPRYHLAGCSQTAGAEEFPLPLADARAVGFTACGICRPDRHLAEAERRRRAAAEA